MKSKVWKKSIQIMVSLLLVLSFVNTVGDTDANSGNDRAISSKVWDKLQTDSQLMGSAIYVEAKDGEVTLKGTVNSQADINRAVELAQHVDGVKKVDNRLTTVSSHRYGATAPRPNCQIGANWAC
jgi:Flp pilus assembly secretin CpaC